MSLKLHLNIWIINIFWMDLGVSLKIIFEVSCALKKKKMSLFRRWWIKNPIFFCCLVSFYWLNLQRQTDINKRWRRTNTQGWRQQQQQKTLYTPKVCVEDSGIKKTWKIPVVYLKARASPFIAALIRVTHADPGREQNNKKKRNSSHSWLTALINKREDGGGVSVHFLLQPLGEELW